MEHYKNDDLWCVYYHKCRTSGKYYVGITKDTTYRWRLNGRMYNNCTHFYHAIQKYGWNDFDHVVLLSNLEHEQAKAIEIQLIAKFDLMNPANGYNITEGGDGGPIMIGADNPWSKPIYQYSLAGDFITKWETLSLAGESLNISPSAITNAASGKSHYARGYQWSYEKVEKLSPYTGKIFGKKEYPRVYKISFDGELVKIYDDLHKIQDFDPVKYNRVRAVCLGEGKSAYGFFWLFEPDYSEEAVRRLIYNKNHPALRSNAKKVCVYNKSGELIDIFPSKKHVAKYYSLTFSSVDTACSTKYHRVGDYLFYYYDDTQGQNVDPWIGKGRFKNKT